MPTQEDSGQSHPRGKWASRRDLATAIGRAAVADSRVPPQAREHMDKTGTVDAMTEAIETFGLSYEFKILRLIEKVKEAMMKGAFGPIYIPNTVNVDGERIPTPVGEIALLLKDIYTPAFLDQFDEEGEPL